MDIRDFLMELLPSLARLELVRDIDLRVESVTVSGRIFLEGSAFLEIYYNEVTGTIAFALIEGGRRVWGIDRDNIRGWHRHPPSEPSSHLEISPLSISEIVAELAEVLKRKGDG